jgi:hypothetical protein
MEYINVRLTPRYPFTRGKPITSAKGPGVQVSKTSPKFHQGNHAGSGASSQVASSLVFCPWGPGRNAISLRSCAPSPVPTKRRSLRVFMRHAAGITATLVGMLMISRPNPRRSRLGQASHLVVLRLNSGSSSVVQPISSVGKQLPLHSLLIFTTIFNINARVFQSQHSYRPRTCLFRN